MRNKIKECRDCPYYPNDCRYWDRNKRKREKMIDEETGLKCQYCGRKWQPWAKFYNIECCVECHKNGNENEFIDKHRD